MEFLQALEPWMIPIIIMICVTLIVAISVVGNIITTSMKKKEKGSLSENQEFLNALREFKENMDRRVSNLEKIAAAENPSTNERVKSQGKQKQSAIELELDDDSPQEQETNQSSKLKNMLNQ